MHQCVCVCVKECSFKNVLLCLFRNSAAGCDHRRGGGSLPRPLHPPGDVRRFLLHQIPEKYEPAERFGQSLSENVFLCCCLVNETFDRARLTFSVSELRTLNIHESVLQNWRLQRENRNIHETCTSLQFSCCNLSFEFMHNLQLFTLKALKETFFSLLLLLLLKNRLYFTVSLHTVKDRMS